MMYHDMENLIERVRVNPILYDIHHKDYARTALKKKVWNGIARQLDFKTGCDVKLQWRKLRDCHRDALRRQKKALHKNVTMKPWTYQHQMEFIIPHMSSNAVADVHTKSAVELEYVDNCSPVQTLSDDEDDYTNLKDIKVRIPTPVTISANDEPPIKRRKIIEDKKVVVEAKEYSDVKVEETVDVEVAEITSNMDSIVKDEHDTKPRDALYHFFMSMYSLTKVMPEKKQLEVRKKVFEAVSQAEGDLIINSF